VKPGYEERLAAGIVLTGGTAMLEGITELSEQIFNMPVRRGYPAGIGGLEEIVHTPLYATSVGLVMYGSRYQAKSAYKKSESNLLRGVNKKVKRWFSEFF
jgi:cell division protein FtsA